MDNVYFSYRKLNAYIKAKELVRIIYGLQAKFPREENYGLCDQLRRAVISIPSNIAEGVSRTSPKEQIHFIEIAFGSLNEVMCQIEIAYDLGFITSNDLKNVECDIKVVAQLLSGLRNSKKQLLVPIKQ